SSITSVQFALANELVQTITLSRTSNLRTAPSDPCQGGRFRERLLQLVDAQHPSERATDVLERELMQVLAVHACDAIAQYDRRVTPVRGLERRAENARFRVDSADEDGPGPERPEQIVEIRAVERVQRLLVVDDVIRRSRAELRHQPRPGRADQVRLEQA